MWLDREWLQVYSQVLVFHYVEGTELFLIAVGKRGRIVWEWGSLCDIKDEV